MKPDCYIGQKDCGCIVAVVFDDPKFKEDIAATIVDFHKSGYGVRRVVWNDVKHKLKRCKCEMKPPKTDKLGMSSSYYWPLFEHMSRNYGLTLLDYECEDIMSVVDAMQKEEQTKDQSPNQ